MAQKKQKLLSSISVFLPCLNEAENIKPLVKKLDQSLTQVAHKYEIIIVNDGSTDTTKKVVKQLSNNNSHLRIVNHPKNLGYGASIITGIKASRYDWIFFTDGDGQFNVAELTSFIPYAEDYNVIIGYRTNRADGQLRALNARVFKLFIDVLFRVHVKDIDCAFKLTKAKVVKPLPLMSTGAMVSSEMLYRLKKRGETFMQLPVNHYPRKYGNPTGNNLKVIIKAGIEALRLYFHMKFGSRTK